MLLITGATGQLGQLVVQSLLKKVPANQIAVAVRNPQKAAFLKELGVEVRQADYNEPQMWTAALAGIEKLLLISGNEVGSRLKQHQVVIDAAKKYGKLKLLAYTSLLRADTSNLVLAAEHKATENLIKESGIPYSLLRNGWYTENYTMSVKSALEHGALFGAAKEGRISSASRQDYADAAVAVLTIANPKQVYELAGDTSYTLANLAAEITKQSGKNVVYNDMSESDFSQLLQKVGLPQQFAAILAQSDAAAAAGDLFDESHELSQLIDRKTTALATMVQSALK